MPAIRILEDAGALARGLDPFHGGLHGSRGVKGGERIAREQEAARHGATIRIDAGHRACIIDPEGLG